MENFHYLARGICSVDGYILLAQYLRTGNTFLPGGHIDFGERAEDCLIRELKEELSLEDVRVGRFLGAVEHKWEQAGHEHCEINLIFALQLPGMDPPNPPQSHEQGLDFLWAKPEELGKLNLQSSPLVDAIQNQTADRKAIWGSTLVARSSRAI